MSGRLTDDRLDRYALTLTVSGTELALRVPRIYGHVRLDAASAATIGGIAGFAAGRVLRVTAIGSDVTLEHENTSADARARLDLPGDADVVLEAGDTATLIYDASVTGGVGRWRLVERAALASGGGGGVAAWPEIFRRVNSAQSVNDDGNSQPWFPSDSVVALEADSLYELWGTLRLLTGPNSHGVRVGFDLGTVGITQIAYSAVGIKRTMNQAGTTSQMIMSNSTNNVQVTAANTTAGAVVDVRGTVRTSTAGTFGPSFSFTAAPGGLGPTVQHGSSFAMQRIAGEATDRAGTWS